MLTAFPVPAAVDNTMFSPESPLYPSAVKALAAAAPQRIAGVSGAGVTSLCNPESANYEKFYAVLGKGSWLQELPQATHLSYAQTPLAATPVCGKGSTTPLVRLGVESTAALTAHPQSRDCILMEVYCIKCMWQISSATRQV
jgi:hypothetical protein